MPDQTGQRPSVQHRLHTETSLGWASFVTSINMPHTNDCKAYIDKLEYFGANYSRGNLFINALQAGYANIKYYFDDVGRSDGGGLESSNSIVQNGVAASNVTYASFGSGSHITSATNVAGYYSWGANGGFGPDYALDGTVNFTGSSRWYIIATSESFNGQFCDPVQGTFWKWASPNAFGGSDYSNMPVGAVTHVGEPGGNGGTAFGVYFGLWVQNKNFAICAWNSWTTVYCQAVGDPFVKR